MLLAAVIIIGFYSLSDLSKWLDQNGATDKDKLIVMGVIILVIFIIGCALAVHE